MSWIYVLFLMFVFWELLLIWNKILILLIWELWDLVLGWVVYNSLDLKLMYIKLLFIIVDFIWFWVMVSYLVCINIIFDLIYFMNIEGFLGWGFFFYI